MPEIIALFTVFIPHLSATTTRQLCRIVLALLAMAGRVTMTKNLNPPHNPAIITQVATNKFSTFQGVFTDFSPPRRGDMSIENGIFKQLHPVGVLCL